MKKLVILLMLTFSLTSASFAQEIIHSILQDTINLEEVVVTGTTMRVNRKNVPMSVSVVNNLQLSESTETNLLPILNGRVPGLFVTERGIMGFGVAGNAAGQISIRGIGGSPTTGVLMLIDGHPQFMGIFGHPLADSYVASDVERVEVIRGPASILYGSNAMGGVINIITKKQSKDGFHGNAHVMYGSYNTQKYMVSAGFKKKNFNVFASVNHDQTDGHRPNADFTITNGYIKTGWRLNENLTTSTDFGMAIFKTTDPGPDTLNSVPGNTLDITRGYWSFTLDNNYSKSSGSAKIFYNFGEHFISDGFHSNDANYGLNFYEAVKLFKNNSLTLGIDYLNYGGLAENEKAMGGAGIVFKDTSIFDAGFYGFMQQSLFERLTLNAGLRLQYHEVYGQEFIPSGGFTFKISDLTTWKGSVAKGFRSPTIQELYIWNHNSNLNPETIFSYEMGMHHNSLSQNLKLELTGFIVRGSNLIINVPMEGLQNAGEVSNTGIEFAATAKPAKDLALNLTYSYINMKKPVFATPKHHLWFSGNYTLKKFQIMSSLQFVNGLDTDPSNLVRSENYTLLNSKISYRATKFSELFLSAENLFDIKYETNKYYTMPGITIFGGIKVRL